ncbi:MAG: MOSC domain-containing protein [Sphingobacteriaceae bacterium]|nr:MAG: MOSC domain-containing protein [Sphingobacteriaceae bacterium]
MLKISEIYIYPIKSLGGISVNQAEVTDRGFKYDRRWMLIDDNNRFLSQREVATMALLKVSLSEDGLNVVNTTDGNNLFVPYTPQKNEFFDVTIWDDTCTTQLVSDEADKWFTQALGINCKLVYMPDDSHRLTDARYADNITSLSDGYPFMMIGQASLDELNGHLDEALSINRFRPNMVFTGGTPYQEDRINEFTINDISFNGVKLCARCNVTTINQDDASKGKEPLKTLAGYRSKNKKIYFGQNVVHTGVGVVNVGDELIVLSTHNEERFIIS